MNQNVMALRIFGKTIISKLLFFIGLALEVGLILSAILPGLVLMAYPNNHFVLMHGNQAWLTIIVIGVLVAVRQILSFPQKVWDCPYVLTTSVFSDNFPYPIHSYLKLRLEWIYQWFSLLSFPILIGIIIFLYVLKLILFIVKCLFKYPQKLGEIRNQVLENNKEEIAKLEKKKLEYSLSTSSSLTKSKRL